MRGNFKWMASLVLLLASFTAMAAIGKKDTVMVFRPAPGLNDSTDFGGINGGMDVLVQQPYPNTNYKDHTWMYAVPISNCNSTHASAYIRFDVSTLPKNVDSVFVGFTHHEHTSYCYSNCNADFYFHRVTQRWYENVITYADQPASDTAFYGPINISFPNNFGNREYDITGTYRLWRDSVVDNFGMVIQSPTVGCNNAAVGFYAASSDDTTDTVRPYLRIYYKIDTGHVDTTVAVGLVNTDAKVKLYPNPANTETHVLMPVQQPGNGWYAVTDMAGRVLLRKDIYWQQGANTVTIPLLNLETGIYLYILQTPDGIYKGKLLKE